MRLGEGLKRREERDATYLSIVNASLAVDAPAKALTPEGSVRQEPVEGAAHPEGSEAGAATLSGL